MLCLLGSSRLMAQAAESAPGLMMSSLKLYVVVAVLLIIFAGIAIFLIGLERRLKKLEGK